MLLNFLVYFLVALTKDGCSVRKASVLKMLSLNLNVFCLRWYVSTFARLSVGQVFYNDDDNDNGLFVSRTNS